MSSAPPKSVQHRFIQRVQKELTRPVDQWEYAVSTKWVAFAQQVIQGEEALGEIPPLIASDWDQENIYIGENSWKVLASWYGVDKQYSCRRRSTMPSCYVSLAPVAGGDHGAGDGFILADNKLDYVTVFCCLLKDLSSEQVKHQYITVYFWDSLDYIEFQLRCALKMHPKKDARMWLSFSDDGAEIFLENLTTWRNQHTTLGTVICRNHPEVLELLQKRQTLPVGYPGYSGAASLGAIGHTKGELWDMFLDNQWQVTLCLEELPMTVGEPSDTQSLTQSRIPPVFQNLHLDYLFQKDSEDFIVLDERLERILDDSVQEFSELIKDQRSKIEMRVQDFMAEARESHAEKETMLQTKMEKLTAQETQLAAREKELNERDHELNSKLAKFKSMLTEFLTKKDKFEKEVAIMAEQNKIASSKVELNVGGVRYTTSVSTLTKEEGSLLQTMFSGQHAISRDTDGSYFIDRDGTNFRHVLNFLRDGPASLQHISSNDQRLLSELRVEAEYYQLPRMADVLKTLMSGGKTHGAYASLPS